MSDIVRGIGELGETQIRSALKAQFEQLLDAAAAARNQNCDSSKYEDVVALAAQLMRKVLGEIAHIPLETENEAPLATRDALKQWLPVFSREEDTIWIDLTDELLLLSHGDHPSLLVPKKRDPGGRDFRTALMKLSALRWDAFLKTNSGRKAKEYQAEIAFAFLTNWGAIEKWKSLQSEPMFNESVENAGKGIGEGLCYPEYEEALWSDGDRYRRQTGRNLISFEEFLAKIRNN